MDLTLTLDEHIARMSILHHRLCPKQIIGVRMARHVCREFGIDPVHKRFRKKMFVYMEIGHCTSDGVIVVTGCSPTNGHMRILDYGKVAATFLNLVTGRAIRVSEHPSSRIRALEIFQGVSPWEAQLQAYRIMPEEELLSWADVELLEDYPELPGRPSHVVCDICGEVIHDHNEVVEGDRTICKHCYLGARSYYRLRQSSG